LASRGYLCPDSLGAWLLVSRSLPKRSGKRTLCDNCDNALPTEGTALDATGPRQLASIDCDKGSSCSSPRLHDHDPTTRGDLGGGGARGPGHARVGLLGLQCSARALFRAAPFKIKNDTHRIFGLWLDWATIQFRFIGPAARTTGSFCVFGPVLSSPAHGSPSLTMDQIEIEIF
jgi:hypothetical protein